MSRAKGTAAPPTRRALAEDLGRASRDTLCATYHAATTTNMAAIAALERQVRDLTERLADLETRVRAERRARIGQRHADIGPRPTAPATGPGRVVALDVARRARESGEEAR